MDTIKKYGIRKDKAILLFLQMLLTIVITVISIYLLIFIIINNLGPWMISSYIFICLSTLAIICYGMIGYKRRNCLFISDYSFYNCDIY